MGTPVANQSISSALFGRTRQAVLTLLYGHPDESFYLRQIARMADSGQGGVQRELKRLTAAGIIKRSGRGRRINYQANRDSPVFAELRGLVVKSSGMRDLVHAAVAPLADRIDVALVYGSFARSDQASASDVDLLVVGAVTFDEVARAVTGAEEGLGREVNPTVYPAEEFGRKLRAGNHFLRGVLAGPKIFIIGGESELRGLVAERLVGGAPDQ